MVRKSPKTKARSVPRGFFTSYPNFLKTSEQGAHLDRLNARHVALIATNKAHIEGKRVLDLASHDGRWSFAALQAGASYVHGIEAREHLVENSEINFSLYGV